MAGIRQPMLKKTKSRIRIRITRTSGGVYVAFYSSSASTTSCLFILFQAVSCESAMALPQSKFAPLRFVRAQRPTKNGQCALPYKSASSATKAKRRLEN